MSFTNVFAIAIWMKSFLFLFSERGKLMRIMYNIHIHTHTHTYIYCPFISSNGKEQSFSKCLIRKFISFVV